MHFVVKSIALLQLCTVGHVESLRIQSEVQHQHSKGRVHDTMLQQEEPVQKVKPLDSEHRPCMLVPVYPAHFEVLNARLLMTKRTNVGPLVKTVVVFGDENEQSSFCSQFPAACRNDTGFHGISLETLLGAESLAQLSADLGMTKTESEVIRQEEFGGDRMGCWAKSEGRVLQTVKKFYGAAYGPSECSMYWTSDAESIPFRKHNLQKLLMASADQPFSVSMKWQDDPKCAHVHADEGTDASCAALFASQANGFRDMEDRATSKFTKDFYSQDFWFVDHWWIYEPRTTALWLDHLKKVSQREAWDFISHYRASDSSVYHIMFEWLATQSVSPKPMVKNIRDVLRDRQPQAFEACCECNAESDAGDLHPPPCAGIHELLGNGCLKQIPVAERLKLVTKDLGIFGVGNYNRFFAVPDETLNAQLPDGTGIHWCFNNCFKPETFQRLMDIENSDAVGLMLFKQAFYETNV